MWVLNDRHYSIPTNKWIWIGKQSKIHLYNRSCISIHHYLQKKITSSSFGWFVVGNEGMNPHYDDKYDSIPSFPTKGPPTSLPCQITTCSNKIYADNILQACFFGQDLADGKQTYPGVKPALPTKVLLRTGSGEKVLVVFQDFWLAWRVGWWLVDFSWFISNHYFLDDDFLPVEKMYFCFGN